MARINYTQLRLEIEKPMERAFRQVAIKLAEDKFEGAKDEFLDKFATDPVSLEIAQGPGLRESPILGIPGNLFGFLGFNEGDSPIDDLYDYFVRNIKLNKSPSFSKSTQTFAFTVNVPSKDEIAGVTEMEWGTAQSWALSIESGIPGLNHYLYTKAKASRSGAGIQIKGQLTTGGFSPHKYISNLLNFLKDALK